MPQNTIDNIMDMRKEMKFLSLRQKYSNCNFPTENNNSKTHYHDHGKFGGLKKRIKTEVEQSDLSYF